MRTLDTNVLLRYIVQDDERQAAIACDLIETQLSDQHPGFVPLIVICEAAWTLRRTYRLSNADVRELVGSLLAARQLVVDERDVVVAALREDVPDLADAIIHHLGLARGCSGTVTFDAEFGTIEGVELLG